VTRREFEDEVVRITTEHLQSIRTPLDLMIDMLGPHGFGRDELVAILVPIYQAIELAEDQLAGVGKPAKGSAC
jgi:hypothetical protein